MRRLHTLLAFACLALSLHSAETTYEAQLATARQFATEGSWAKARDAYAAARALAPDSSARNQCTLSVADAAWRAMDNSSFWKAKLEKRELGESSFEQLLVPYQNGRPHDDFWCAIMESYTGLKAKFWPNQPPWSEWLEIADFLANQPQSPENAAKYTIFLLQLLDISLEMRTSLLRDQTLRYRLCTHVEQASQLETRPAERAWFALNTAELSESQFKDEPDRLAAAYQEAVARAVGTPNEGLVRAREFVWRLHNNRLKLDAQKKPDIPSWLDELQTILALLEKSPSTEPVKDAKKTLKTFLPEWTQAHLSIAMPALFRPEEPIRFTYGATYTKQLTFEIFRIDPQDWYNTAAKDFLNKPGAPVSAEKLHHWSVTLKPATPHAWQSRVETIPVPLSSGLYVLVASADGTALQARKFSISRYGAAAFNATDNDYVFCCYDSQTGQPVAQASVDGWAFTYKEAKPIATFTTATDSNGQASWNQAPKEVRQVALRINGCEPVLIQNLFKTYPESDPNSNLLLDLFLDRELFRPGETVHWKLIGRNRKAGQFVAPPNGLTAKIQLNNEPLGLPEKIVWNTNGTASGELVIPATAPTGQAKLTVLQGEKEVANLDFFTVDNFMPPPVLTELDLASSADSLRSGGSVDFRVKARYYSGGPVTGAPVEFRFATAAYYLEENPSVAVFKAWQAENSKKLRTGITDANGCATFHIDLPVFPVDYVRLYCASVVKPVGITPITQSKDMIGSETGLRFVSDSFDNNQLVRPGKPFTLQFKCFDGFDRPASFNGEAVLSEMHWQEIWLDPDDKPLTYDAIKLFRRQHGLLPDKNMPAGWKKLHAGYSYKPILSVPITTGNDGITSFSLVAPKEGVYELRINTDHGPIKKTTRFWTREGGPGIAKIFAADEHTTDFDLPLTDSALVGPARISANETPEFLIVLPEGETNAILALSGETETRAQCIHANGRVAFTRFNHPPAFSHSGKAQMIWNRSYYYRYDTSFVVDSPKDNLTCLLIPPAEVSRPGETTSVLLRVLNNQHKPIRTELAFAVADESVNQLTQRPIEEPPIFTGYDHTRSTEVVSSELWEQHEEPLPLRDPRLGVFDYEERVLRLSPYEIAAERSGSYAAASATLAGTRLHMKLEDATAAEQTLGNIQIRRHFSSTAYWAPSLMTDAKGEAHVTFKYPDNLTQWRLSAYAVGENLNSFGTATTFTRTSLPFQARLQLPRFLVTGDTALVSAALINRSNDNLSASTKLVVEGAAAIEQKSAQHDTITVPRQDEAHIDWELKANQPGTAKLLLTSRAGLECDAMELPLPILENGIEQKTAASNRLAPETRECTFTIPLPSPLDPARTLVTVQLNAGYASTLLDALPYLVDYPYGCVEQTMSRFLPAVVVRKTLQALDFPSDVVESRIRTLESPADKAQREKTAGLSRLDDVIAQSLSRLQQAQNHNGGFGWWPGDHEPDLWMTAYVVWGLNQAKQAGITIPEELFTDANEALVDQIADPKSSEDVATWALAAVDATDPNAKTNKLIPAFERIYAKRNTLSASGRACLTLAANKLGRATELPILLRNLENGAERIHSTDLGDTVHWGSSDRYWRAMDGSVESTALTLLALLEIDPKNALVNPATNWLLLNRRSAHWTNTRDTAFALLALARGLELRGDTQPEGEIELLVNGSSTQRLKFSHETLLQGPTSISLDLTKLKPSQSAITLPRLTGKTTIYAVAHSTAWAQGDTVKPEGHQLTLERKLTREKAQPTLIGTPPHTRTAINRRQCRRR